MKIILDSNILFSALIKNSKTRELIFEKNLDLFAPKKLIREINKYEKEISKKSGLSIQNLRIFNQIILKKIIFIEEKEYENLFKKANELCPDKNDVEFFALALKYKIPIWTNDKILKKQNEVKVLNTNEVLEFFC